VLRQNLSCMSDREQRDPGVRRIVVGDESRPVGQEVRGRKLQSPPSETPVVKAKTKRQRPGVRREFLFAGVGAVVVLVMLLAAFALRRSGNQLKTKRAQVKPSPEVSAVSAAAPQSQESVQIEDDAKQVVRRMSRDNKPYSFSEQAVKDIESRVTELSRGPSLSDTLAKLHEKSAAIGTQATKAGLQSSLVILVGLAMSKGGEKGDCIAAANRALPQLASLNKTFGSIEAESCLVLIAALSEGVGTARSHPLLKRMNKVVNNPLTERNVWYLHDQKVISEEAYELVVNTIAYGVIAANPQRFGLSNDPLSF
jgi:hypothetical protein